jgi:type I restriction enzyme S subunit
MRKTYSKYKSSEVEWIGEIPTHWDCGKMKYVLSNNDGGVWGNDVENEEEGNIVIRSTEITIDGNWDFSNPLKRILTENEISKSKLYEGDIVITKSSGSPQHIGKSVIVSKEIELMNCCYSNFVQRIRFRNYNPKLYHFILNSDIGRSQFKYLTTSSTGLGNLNGSSLNDVLLPFIPLNEQEQIVKYLDEKTTQIDNLISITEDKINLLKQKRTSQINEVVTKGLNKEVKLKDSGVEWIGEIPTHWDRVCIKRLVSTKLCDGPHITPNFIETGVPFISVESIKDDKIDFDFLRGYISEEDDIEFSKKTKPKKDDILLVKSGSTTGKVTIVETDIDFNIWSPLCLIRTKKEKVLPRFVFLSMKSDFFQITIQQSWSFGTQPNIGMGVIENLFLVIPPIKEQKDIISFIDKENKKIDDLISIEKRRVETLKEYRQSLISEVITGKIKVIE